MERPLKRPRLSIFSSNAPDAELDDARHLNDLSLKSQFEAIFEKYSQDFTGIGDEINVQTGQVVVNNGHLESMEGETDTGENGTPVQGAPHVTGKSLLRAMTVVPEVEDTYDENAVSSEVITSIETMAENAGLVEEESESEDDLLGANYSREGTDTPDAYHEEGELESEDDLFGVNYSRRGTDALDNTHEEDEPILEHVKLHDNYSSGEDSLLGTGGGRDGHPYQVSERSESPDSLFDGEQHSSTTSQAQRAWTSSSPTRMRGEIDPDMSNEAIIDRFGPDVGNQVLGLIEHRSKPNENHLEEAWRIPVDIGPTRSSEKTATPLNTSSITSRTTSSTATSRDRELSPNHTVSLWGNQPRPQRKRKRRRKPIVQRVHTPDGYREESEDPLQEDFSRGTRRRPGKKLSEGVEDVSSGDEVEDDQQASSREPEPVANNNEETDASDRPITRIHDDSEDSDYGASKRTKKRPVRNTRRKKRTYLVPEERRGDTIKVDRGDFIPISDKSSVEDASEGTPQPEDSGFCSYCNRQFSCRSSIMAHWDRLLRKPASQLPADDPHDMNLIRFYRGSKSERIRCPRLTLVDFRTMVELYEGGGTSFVEISESRVLRTRKTGSQLQDLYDRHRSVPGTSHDRNESAPWTAEEEQTLQALCGNTMVTIATLKRNLQGRDEVDIGDKLADGWLRLLERAAKPEAENVTATEFIATWGTPPPEIRNAGGRVDDAVEIKEEED